MSGQLPQRRRTLLALIHAVFGHKWHNVGPGYHRRCRCGAEIPPNLGEWA